MNLIHYDKSLIHQEFSICSLPVVLVTVPLRER